MAEIIWTEPALDQLDELAEYIALDNPAAASALVVKVFKLVDRLERFPNSGREPPELPDSIYREVVCSPCRVFYRREESNVIVLHVMREEMQLKKYLLSDVYDSGKKLHNSPHQILYRQARNLSLTFLFSLVLCRAISAQTPEIGLSELPPEMIELRQNQRRLAQDNGVEITQFNVGRRSATSISGVPSAIEDLTIASYSDVEEMKALLYPFYGFTGTETLIIPISQSEPVLDLGYNIYSLQQYISDIPTPLQLLLFVNSETLHIERLGGGLVIDRGFTGESPYSEEEVIQLALDYLADNERHDFYEYKLAGEHFASKILRPYGEDSALDTWWHVYVEISEPVALPDGTFHTHDLFHVDPDGNTIGDMELGPHMRR